MTGMSSDNVSFMTGMSKLGIKKNKKPRNLHQRRYKENSVYEEEWLVESLNVLDYSNKKEKQLEHLLHLLTFFSLTS